MPVLYPSCSPDSIVISPEHLYHLIGTPWSPVLLDVRISEDIEDCPSIIPTSRLVSYTDVSTLLPYIGNQSVIVYCQKGGKISQGAAAILRHQGIHAQSLTGGHLAWRDLDYPLTKLNKLNGTDPQAPSYWVCGTHPDPATLACIWLIRRWIDREAVMLFVEPGEVAATADKFSARIINGQPPAMSDANTEKLTSPNYHRLTELFGLNLPALNDISKTVDIRCMNSNLEPACPYLAGVIEGMYFCHKDDISLVEASLPLFDACYQWFLNHRSSTPSQWRAS
ncbi:hypothetical protein BTA51_06225 [Hahella sp. CCB-MM4]|uniref:chromate resistance protein ChrB domain-containing protein n=1 Tax=Hahella sp. (strain CCB-MM4) TaxID=1926491 RepID=UPI000B9B87FA|nr:chromate resistance protein ChrB domain-containing protein [Hahella sp. CCB-MM4]OZG74591.1 hypothetical protein BTA51_06225 [Hahella sp. CCB-MM4]